MTKINLFRCLLGMLSMPLITFTRTYINIENPQGVFCVDGAMDIVIKGIPTVVQ